MLLTFSSVVLGMSTTTVANNTGINTVVDLDSNNIVQQLVAIYVRYLTQAVTSLGNVF